MKNKKFVLMAIAIVLVVIFIIFYANNKKSVIFDLNNTVYSYELSTAKEENEYKKFVFQNIKPEKLKNFIEYNDVDISGYAEKATGETLLHDFTYKAYRNLLESLFSINRTNFDNCPVSSIFLSKYSKNLSKEFNMHGEENYLLDFDFYEHKFNIEDRWNIAKDGEAEFAELYHFSYKLDDDGSIDEIILERKGWE